MERPDTRILIVPATMAYGNVISALHTRCFDEGWTPFTVRQVLAMPGSAGLLAVPEGYGVPEPDLAGFVIYRLAADECEILSLAVADAWRRSGVGRGLLEGAIARAREGGAASIFLEVAEDNHAAQNLYRQYGFAAVGRRKDYYKRRDGPPVAALTFSLMIGPG